MQPLDRHLAGPPSGGWGTGDQGYGQGYNQGGYNQGGYGGYGQGDPGYGQGGWGQQGGYGPGGYGGEPGPGGWGQGPPPQGPGPGMPPPGKQRPPRRDGGSNTGPIIFGIILVLLGAWFLVRDQVGVDLDIGRWWPAAIVALGVILVILSFIRRPRD